MNELVPATIPPALVLATTVVAVGLMICRVIGGLKDQPLFADYFAAHPQASMILNAVFSLLTALAACFAMGTHDPIHFAECLLMALGTFLAASGWHRHDKRTGPATPPSGAGPLSLKNYATATAARDTVVIETPATDRRNGK